MTHLVTHVEVLLEKAAGAFWGENSKERSLLVNTYPSSLILAAIVLSVASWLLSWFLCDQMWCKFAATMTWNFAPSKHVTASRTSELNSPINCTWLRFWLLSLSKPSTDYLLYYHHQMGNTQWFSIGRRYAIWCHCNYYHTNITCMWIICESNRGHKSVSNSSARPLTESLWKIVEKMFIVFKNIFCIQERSLFKSVPGKNLMFSFRCYYARFWAQWHDYLFFEIGQLNFNVLCSTTLYSATVDWIHFECTVLYSTLLYCTVLYYTVLYSTLLYYTLNWIVLDRIVLHVMS